MIRRLSRMTKHRHSPRARLYHGVWRVMNAAIPTPSHRRHAQLLELSDLIDSAAQREQVAAMFAFVNKGGGNF